MTTFAERTKNIDPQRIWFYPYDLPKDLPLSAIQTVKDNGVILVTMPISDWITFNGRGFLCSTEA